MTTNRGCLARHAHARQPRLRGARLPQWIAAVLASDLAQLHSFAKACNAISPPLPPD
ncbi:hypothetical protein AB0M95_22790 [Sphaerisporangium sp. NPDC051017]|uniref:hypothetical protein n=1 Tax=Sphaerisporangium sp. NPDC051017 TaxID=3154636 RepID=UPI00343BCC5A